MLTDEQIIKALECCAESKQQGCLHCPISDKCLSGEINICACVLNLINRKTADIDFYKERANKYEAQVEVLKEQTHQQKAEIERLRKILENRGEICKSCDEKYTEKIKRAKDETIKEFAEKVDYLAGTNIGITNQGYHKLSADIKNLVKEMVGE